MVWNLFPFNGIFSFGKSQITWHQIWAVGRLSHLGDLMFHQKTLHKHEWAHCCDKAANHQLPIAVAFWIIPIVSAEECSSLMQNLMHIPCSTHSVIVNVMTTQYTCSVNSVYCLHWLVQWWCHFSHMCIPVHCPWLPSYIDVAQTICTILIMVGLFPDRPCIIHITWYTYELTINVIRKASSQ